jgi:hypothetical protein
MKVTDKRSNRPVPLLPAQMEYGKFYVKENSASPRALYMRSDERAGPWPFVHIGITGSVTLLKEEHFGGAEWFREVDVEIILTEPTLSTST